jgi:hypothetical protein
VNPAPVTKTQAPSVGSDGSQLLPPPATQQTTEATLPEPVITGGHLPPAGVHVGTQTEKPNIQDTNASFSETAYPQIVRRESNGSYVPVNIPVGWKLVPLHQLRYDPAPTISLANTESYKLESAPFALVPDSALMKTAINPAALQVLYNFHLAQLDLLRQLKESLVEKPVTPIN